MTYYLYVRPDGHPEVTDFEVDLKFFPGNRFLSTSEERPNVDGKKFVNGQWVWGRSEPEYEYHRKAAYPGVYELAKALWKAMDDGTLPKVAGFYDKIEEIHKRFPPS